jgi:Ala-tRNA(Pro) deacylase
VTDPGQAASRVEPPSADETLKFAAPVYERLTAMNIAYERYEHPPVATVEEAERHWSGLDAVHCKNLFLRNQKGNRHYLVIVEHSKRADLRAVANQIGDGKLSFGSPERLMTYLGVMPGSVSPFGLINDREHHVRVFLDRVLRAARRISFHPNINTITLTLAYHDFERFLASSGNTIKYVDV